MNEKKVLVVHPGKQHSLRLAEGLFQNGFLFQYITTMYDKPGTVTHFLTNILTGQDKKKAKGRKSQILPDSKVTVLCEMTGLLGRLLDRFFPIPFLYHNWNLHLNNRFAKKVAKYAIKNKIDLIISFDNNSTKLFEILEKHSPNIIRVLDASSVNRLYMKNIYEEDMKYSNNGYKREQYNLWEEKTVERLAKEIRLTDFMLVPTSVVEHSYTEFGVENSQIYLAPYGVDSTKFEYVERMESHNPLRLIYVGHSGYKKGTHHLLKILTHFSKDEVILQVVGTYNEELYQKYRDSENIEFCGFVTHDRLNIMYQNSDAYIISSVGEGMGMAAIEAMATGLPIICTEMSGVADAITNGKNGFVLPTLDDEAMISIIRECIQKPQLLNKMGSEARKTAEKYSWQQYYKNVSEAIEKILSC